MPADIMTFPGSLLSDEQWGVASWDIEQGQRYPALRPLLSPTVLNYAVDRQPAGYRDGCRVNFINGMGVTLGDSIVGLTVCHYLKQRYRDMHISILRPLTAQPAVDALYQRALAAGVIDELNRMPWPLSACEHYDLNIDMGNQLFREDFQQMEMHDYFFHHAGISAQSVADKDKTNRWLALNHPRQETPPFVLFCPDASTPLRQIPADWHGQVVAGLQQRYRLPVKGFSPLVLPGYEDVRAQTQTTDDFIQIISQARFVYTADSSALHIAAAFAVPTHALFTSITPSLRTGYYPHVNGVWIGDDTLRGQHATSDAALLAHTRRLFADYFTKGIFSA